MAKSSVKVNDALRSIINEETNNDQSFFAEEKKKEIKENVKEEVINFDEAAPTEEKPQKDKTSKVTKAAKIDDDIFSNKPAKKVGRSQNIYIDEEVIDLIDEKMKKAGLKNKSEVYNKLLRKALGLDY